VIIELDFSSIDFKKLEEVLIEADDKYAYSKKLILSEQDTHEEYSPDGSPYRYVDSPVGSRS
jgi:hypothetical protein